MDDAQLARILGQFQSAQAAEAWAEFLRTFSPLIVQVIRSLERDPDSTADCYLYVCEQLCRNRFRRLSRFRPDGPASFRTWLCVVVRNLVLDWLRRKFGRGRAVESPRESQRADQEPFGALSAALGGLAPDLEAAGADQIPDHRPDPESQLATSELLAALAKAVTRLEDPDRLLIRLRFEQGLTFEQVAKIAGLPDAQTADRRIRAVLVRLRKIIT